MTDQEAQPDPRIYFNGGEIVDLRSALPLTVGDWRKLKKQEITVAALQSGDVDASAKFAAFILQKAGSTIDVDTLTIGDLTKIIGAAGEADRARPDRPT